MFFRPKSLLGTGQWFKVRENGEALGTLNNGAYFVQVTDPGRHTYTAKLEPEFKDKLILQVDPGATYYVEGSLTKAILVSAADLTPSDEATFEKAAGHLTLATAEPVAGNGTTTGTALAAPAVATRPASAPPTPSEGQPRLRLPWLPRQTPHPRRRLQGNGRCAVIPTAVVPDPTRVLLLPLAGEGGPAEQGRMRGRTAVAS